MWLLNQWEEKPSATVEEDQISGVPRRISYGELNQSGYRIKGIREIENLIAPLLLFKWA